MTNDTACYTYDQDLVQGRHPDRRPVVPAL